MSMNASIVLRFEESFDPLLFVEHVLRFGWFFSEDGLMSILPPENFEDGGWINVGPFDKKDHFLIIKKYAETLSNFSISLMKGDGFDGGSWSFQSGYTEIVLSPSAGSHVVRNKVKMLDSQKYIDMVVDVFFDFYLKPVELSVHQSLSWLSESR